MHGPRQQAKQNVWDYAGSSLAFALLDIEYLCPKGVGTPTGDKPPV